MGQFGDKFRKAREKKGISLDDVSNVTKISARMLQAIEYEHFDQLPGGVFNKGFIRAYARHVGLNDEEAVNEYLACLRQAQIDAQAVWEPNGGSAKDKRPQVAAHQIAANQAVAGKVSRGVGKSGDGRTEIAEREELPGLQLPRLQDVRPPRPVYAKRDGSLPWKPVAVALLLVIAAGVIWQRHMRHVRAEAAGVPATSLPQPAPVQASGSGPAARSPAPSSAGTPSPTKSVKVNGPTASHPNNAAPAKPPSTTTASAANEESADNGEDSNAPAADSANAAPVAKSPARFTLVIHADENSWIYVTADGQPVREETLIAPADASVRANREIVVRIGNAAGVSFVWNGQEIQPQGAEAEVKTFVFDDNGMRPVTNTPGPTQAR